MYALVGMLLSVNQHTKFQIWNA